MPGPAHVGNLLEGPGGGVEPEDLILSGAPVLATTTREEEGVLVLGGHTLEVFLLIII